MITQITKLDVKKEERNYLFFCEQDSPLGEVHDVLGQMLQHVVQIMVDKQKDREDAKSAKLAKACKED